MINLSSAIKKIKLNFRQVFSIDGIYIIGISVNKINFFSTSQAIYDVAFLDALKFNASQLVWDLYYRRLWFYALKESGGRSNAVSLLLLGFFIIYLILEFFCSLLFVKSHIYSLRTSEKIDNSQPKFFAYSDGNPELLWFFNILIQKFPLGKVSIAKCSTVKFKALAILIFRALRLKIAFPSLPLWQIIRSTSIRYSAELLRSKGIKLLLEECADRNQAAILAGFSENSTCSATVFVRSPFMISPNYLGSKVVVPNCLTKRMMEFSNKNVVSIELPFVHYMHDLERRRCVPNVTTLGYGPEIYSIITSKQERSENDYLMNSLIELQSYEILVRRHPQERNLSILYNDCYKNNQLIYNKNSMRNEKLPLNDFFATIDIWISSFSTTILSAIQNGCPVIAIRCMRSPALTDLAKMSCGLLRIVDNNAEFYKALSDINFMINNQDDLNHRVREANLNINAAFKSDYKSKLLMSISTAIHN